MFCLAITGCDLTESEPESTPAPAPPAAAPAPAPEPAPPPAEEPAEPLPRLPLITPPAPTPTPEPAPALGPVKIGSLMDLTGELGEFGGPMDQAVRLAAEHVNAAGGVLDGRMIEILTEDGATSDVISVDAARKLVNVEGVSALVGPLSSGITLAIANAVTVPNQVPQISPSATAPSLTLLEDDDFVFRTAPSDAFQGVVLADLAWELGYRNAAVLFINNAYGQGLADQFEESFAALGGQVTAVAHESGQPSYASELAQATANGPDVLIAVSYPVSAGVYIREAIDSGAADTFLFVDGSRSEDLISAVGAEDLEGAYGTAPGAVDNEGTQRFDAEFAAFAPDAGGIFLRESYDAAILFALAVEAAGSDDPVAIRDALREVSGGSGEEIGPGSAEIARALELLRDGQEINYQGASGPVDLDANGDVSGAMEIWKIENGQIVSERVISE
ncbi:MAG: ABC transporter substrate-binding protein [Chloroflexota bacterium]|nr:ABC transporter substrate-binding protein [Chloroflexota bacterium]